MANEEITIDISPDGTEVKVEGHGFRDSECLSVTKDLEDALLQSDQRHKRLKPEAHRRAVRSRTVAR